MAEAEGAAVSGWNIHEREDVYTDWYRSALLSFDEEDGSILWGAVMPYLVYSHVWGSIDGYVIVYQRDAYYPGTDYLLAVEPRSGRVAWKLSIPVAAPLLRTGYRSGVYIYGYGGGGFTVARLDGRSGAVTWSKKILWRYGSPRHSMLLDCIDAFMAVASFSGNICVASLDASTGELLWSLCIPDQETEYYTGFALADAYCAGGMLYLLMWPKRGSQYVTNELLVAVLDLEDGELLAAKLYVFEFEDDSCRILPTSLCAFSDGTTFVTGFTQLWGDQGQGLYAQFLMLVHPQSSEDTILAGVRRAPCLTSVRVIDMSSKLSLTMDAVERVEDYSIDVRRLSAGYTLGGRVTWASVSVDEAEYGSQELREKVYLYASRQAGQGSRVLGGSAWKPNDPVWLLAVSVPALLAAYRRRLRL